MRTKVKEPGAGRVRHPSETQDIVDKWMTGAVEIAAGDLRDQLDDGTTNPVWTMRGNTQVKALSSKKLLHSGKDGIEPERLEDLVAPSHFKPKLTGQNRTRVELPLQDLLLNLV